MANEHTIYVREGETSAPAQMNKNQSIAQAPNTKNIVASTIKISALQGFAKQMYGSAVSNIGFITGNYELQRKVEFGTKLGTTALTFAVNPALGAIAFGGMAIESGVSMYTDNIKRRRLDYEITQSQILTGKVSVNGSRYG